MTNDATPERREVVLRPRTLHKLNRAADLFGQLEQAIDQWNAEHRVLAPSRVPWGTDESVLELYRPPDLDAVPWDAWESAFHDGAHNLRVALDTLMYEMAHIDGPPTDPGKVAFPITDHPNGWPGKTAALSTVPAGLLERARQCQPWARPDPQTPDPLALVSRMDNWDKHRATGVVLDAMPWFRMGTAETEPLPPELARSQDWPLTGWTRFTFAEQNEPGWGGLVKVYVLPILTFGGLFANVPDAARWLHSEVRRMVEYIVSGGWPAAGFNRVMPEPTWSTADGVVLLDDDAAAAGAAAAGALFAGAK